MREFRPLVIFCDIGLPDGMTGYDVARAIREDSEMSQVFIVALTGYGRDEDQRKAHEAGFDLHLTKPVDYQTLRRTLAALPARV
jgi:CheY-like chemotaxis protein